ncbi:MAG: lysophospholipid acyltransferase family protein [SAR324 cluster bacterium]|nr:lysophospholipid acyltransferase family protein [SAR324 cluster bacterium]
MLKRMIEAAGPLLIVTVLWIIGHTTRKVRVNWHTLEVLDRRGEKCILGVWHNNLMYFMYFLGKLRIAGMISKSRDGDRIAWVGSRLGVRPVRGSSSRFALSAVRESLRALRERNLAITPDGPRGPRYEVQPGIVRLAQLAGVPVVPICWTATRYWEFGSWDRMKLPKPFSTVWVFVGDPIPVAKRDDPEAARREIERAMRRLVRDADRFAGGSLTGREPLLAEVEGEDRRGEPAGPPTQGAGDGS